MAACHPDAEPAPEPPACHPRDAPAPEAEPPRQEGVGNWRQFLAVLLVLAAVLSVASFAAFARRPTTPAPVDLAPGATIYYNEACSDCATYLAGELRPALAAAGIAPVVVKDYINDPAYRGELRALNDEFGIPFTLQSHLATFVSAGNLTVFEGHVPASLIRDALSLPERTPRLLLHQDSMGTVTIYHAWAFEGPTQEYPIQAPLAEYMAWYAANVGSLGPPPPPPAILPLVLATGFVDGLNPCAFAVLLFFITFLYVTRRPRIELARIGILYIFAVFLAYFLIGLGLIAAIMVSSDPHLIARVAGVFVAGLGVFTLVQPYLRGVPNPFHTPAAAWTRIKGSMLKGTQPAAAVSGFLVGLCTFPCSGGVYVATLSLLAARTTYWEGLGYLYLYNLAFILPLVIILVVVSNKRLARRATTWERGHTTLVRQIAGASMVVVGILTVVLA